MIENFVHFHVHSDHSLLDGYGTIEEYINRAKELNMPAIALTDHNTMTGIYSFIKLCKKENIKPICGVEFNIKPIVKENEDDSQPTTYDPFKKNLLIDGTHTHLTVIAKNTSGLKNLFKLIEISYKPENLLEIPRISIKDLIKYKDDLIILSGCPNSELNIRMRLGQQEEVINYLKLMKKNFDDSFYIEIIDNNFATNYDKNMLVKISKKLNIKGILTNDVHYIKEEDSIYQEKFLSLGTGHRMDETPSSKGGMRPVLGGNQRYLKSFEEMKQVFPYDEYEEFYINTLELANEIETVELEYNPHLRPKIEIPEQFKTELEYFDYLIEEGFKEKRSFQPKEIQEESKKRIAFERNVIYGNNFIQYFLVVRDYLNWSVENGYPVGPGRGSVGGSEIAYLLNIHDTDPIRFNLLFERFLSEGRGAIFKIEYDDGTSEEVLVNKDYKVNGEHKYTWQLEIGDEIED